MCNIVTEQFVDLLRRSGQGTDALVRATPLAEQPVIDGGYAIWRQVFEAEWESGNVQRFAVVRRKLRRIA